jgi:hypothetical protein
VACFDVAEREPIGQNDPAEAPYEPLKDVAK